MATRDRDERSWSAPHVGGPRAQLAWIASCDAPPRYRGEGGPPAFDMRTARQRSTVGPGCVAVVVIAALGSVGCEAVLGAEFDDFQRQVDDDAAADIATRDDAVADGRRDGPAERDADASGVTRRDANDESGVTWPDGAADARGPTGGSTTGGSAGSGGAGATGGTAGTGSGG